MASGPSKEELQHYFQNNRQYFDSLAKYYIETDRKYYNKFIAPFYSSFRPQKSSSKLIISIMLFISIMGGAALVYLVMDSDKPVKKETTGRNHEIINPDIIIDTVKPPVETPKTDSTTNIVSVESEDYEKGMKYYHKADFSNAEKYFKLVPKNNKKYIEAQKKLYELQFIKEALDKQSGKEQPTKQNENRKQPLERIH